MKSSEVRGDVFAALEHRAPIRKQEHCPDGDSEGVKGHALRQSA